MDFQSTRATTSRIDFTDNEEDDGIEIHQSVTFASFEWEHIRATSSTPLPTCRNCHTATAYKHYMIVFGGKEGEGRKKFCNDIHVLDLKRLIWTSQVKMSGIVPDVRMGHSAQPYQDKVIFYGGWNGYNVLDDVLIMTPQEIGNILTIDWSIMKSENTPPKRQFHTANILENCMYIFGGGDGKMWLSDLFKFDFNSKMWTWIETTGQKPQGRLQHSSVIHERKIYVFGGEPDRSHQLNDLYALDLDSNQWAKLTPKGTTPSPRVSASAVMMNNKIFFFGGYDGRQKSRIHRQWRNDVFLFNIGENQWEYILAETPPKPRCRHSAIAYKNQIIIFGGNDSEKSYNDVYLLRQQNAIKISESTIKSDYQNILFSSMLSDITFQVENEEIYGHKIVLSTRCEYFKAMFENENKGFNLGDKFVISECRPIVFRTLLQYIYTDEAIIDFNTVYEVLAQADKYMLIRLKNICEDYLIKNISLKNVVDIVNLADRFTAKELKANAMRFLLDNKNKIFNTQDVNMLSKEILIELLKITK